MFCKHHYYIMYNTLRENFNLCNFVATRININICILLKNYFNYFNGKTKRILTYIILTCRKISLF